MAVYIGRMPTACLTSGQIAPTEYRRWDHAIDRFARRDRDLQTVQEWKSLIEQDRMEPITIGVSDRYPDVYVADGHHRAVALMQLGDAAPATFPFRWYWIRWIGVHMEHEPFPFHLLNLPTPTN